LHEYDCAKVIQTEMICGCASVLEVAFIFTKYNITLTSFFDKYFRTGMWVAAVKMIVVSFVVLFLFAVFFAVVFQPHPFLLHLFRRRGQRWFDRVPQRLAWGVGRGGAAIANIVNTAIMYNNNSTTVQQEQYHCATATTQSNAIIADIDNIKQPKVTVPSQTGTNSRRSGS
jgi:hypothetical protein